MKQPVGRPLSQATLPSGHFNIVQPRKRFEFLRGFLRHPAQVGSVVPSSHRLEQRLVRNARISEARSVVEFGPGTGGTTVALLQAMSATAQLLAVELDSEFHQLLGSAIFDPRFHLALGSAEQLADLLADRRMPAPDAIVSGIPFSTMPADVSERVASAVARLLRPGGRFVAYQVRAHVADFVSPHLGQPHQCWEVVNLPPVRVFTWVKGGG